MSEQNYQEILKNLTLEEKASLCSGLTNWLTQPIEKKDENGKVVVSVPSVWVSDGPSGLRKEKTKESGGTNIMGTSEPATCFPGAATTASSWDPELVEEVGKAIANEAKGLKVATVLGPGVNIKRSPLCGRNFEYFSEDPYLAGRMGAAWVHGVQKEGVGTSLKHFLANNQEHIRMHISSIVDERALREIYMPAFEHIVKTEQPDTVMCSYNKLDGVYLSDNKRMLTDVLRDEWGFKGIVVSDWGAVNDRVEGIRAGLDLEMPGNKGLYDRHIVKAVKDGSLDEKELDRVVLRMLRYVFESKAREVKDFKVNFDESHNVARKAARESAVLLKNEDKALPLKGDEKIAVIGKLAEQARYQGAGSSHIAATKIVPFLNALDEAKQPYEYAEGYTLKGDGRSAKLLKEAVELAKGKDKVLVFVGLTDAYESEGYDRTHLEMPPAHNELIDEILKVNPNVIVILSLGAPVVLGDWKDKVKAILNMYIGGQAVGEATYDLVFGKVNPSGKLAETYPLKNEDNIVAAYFPMGPRTVEYRESVYVGYRYFDKANKPVQYPFGYGLSYTTFEYSNLALSADRIKESDGLTVSFDVTNTGDVAGAEVAQLYVEDVESAIFRPVKELKGFKKVHLEPGETKRVEIALDSRSFAYYNVLIKDWHVESGEFNILIGASSRDVKLSKTVYVESENPSAPIPDYRATAPYYYDLKGDEIPAEQFKALYGKDLPENAPYKKGELTANNSIGQCNVSAWGRFINRTIKFVCKLIASSAENPEMIINSAMDMPVRAAAQWSNGLISERSLEGLVDMLNGKRGGFGKFIGGFKKKYKK